MERGRNAPSFGTLDKIARRLKMPVGNLFTFNAGKRGPEKSEKPRLDGSLDRNISDYRVIRSLQD